MVTPYGLSLARRHMTAGQRAMVAAKLYPEPDAKGSRGKKGCVAQQFPMVDKGALARARAVLTHAPDLVDGVLGGSSSLDKAADAAKARLAQANSSESKLAELNEHARDLADLVKEERLSVDEAIATLRERQRKDREAIFDWAASKYCGRAPALH
jgi:hypothetical protein